MGVLIMTSKLTVLFALPLLTLAACTAPAEEESSESGASEVVTTVPFQLAGKTELACDGGQLCTLRGSVHSIDGRGAKTRAFADYLSGAQPYTDRYHAATCTLTFGQRAQPIGRGYLDAPNGCGLPSASGGYTGDFDYAFSLSRDEVARALGQNVTLQATSWNGKSKFVISFAIEPSFEINGGSLWPSNADASTVSTSLPADMYGFSFERSSADDVAIRVRRSSDGGGRWISRLNGPAGTDYEATEAEGLALYDGSKGADGVGYAAVLDANVFVDRAVERSYWKVSVQTLVPDTWAQMSAEPRIGAAPFALGTRGGREGYSHDAGDVTGLSGCKRDGTESGWTCKLVVAQ